jgi:ABC-type transport system substrate-binding protein
MEEYPGSYWQDRSHLHVAAWVADYPDPDNFLRVAFRQAATGWHNEEYNQLVAEARRLLDQGERMALYRQADRIMVEEAPFVAPVYMQSQVLIKPWVKGYAKSAMGYWSSWKDVVIEPH